MNRVWDFIVRKRFEFLLAIVAGIFGFVSHLQLFTLCIAWLSLIVVLFTYDLATTREALYRLYTLIKIFSWEILLFVSAICLLVLWNFPFEYTILTLIFCTTIVLSLRENFLRRGVHKGIVDIQQQPLLGILILVTSVLFFIWNSNVITTIFLSAYVAFLLYQWDSRVFAALALISLATCPILLSLNQNALAEIMAQYAYFFLVMTVTLQIVEFKRHPERFEEDEEKHE